MADFQSNFNDIQKQIAVADLTDEQIQELVNALQTRRSARPELAKKKGSSFNVAESVEVMPTTRIWILLSALIVALLRLSNTERAKADRDISARIVTALSGIPTAQLPFAPSCLLVCGLS